MNIKVCVWLLIAVIFFVPFQGCDSDEPEILPEPSRFPGVEEALIPYFERFEAEAKTRGMNIDLNKAGIEGVIREIHKDRVVGQCSYSYANPRLVTVDAGFWKNASPLYREFIIFHELGHCFLNRGHLEESFNNGLCVSIMRSGNGSCFDGYNVNTRNYYINELFDADILK